MSSRFTSHPLPTSPPHTHQPACRLAVCVGSGLRTSGVGTWPAQWRNNERWSSPQAGCGGWVSCVKYNWKLLQSILKIAAFLAPRRLPLRSTGAAALMAESWQSRYYIIVYIIDVVTRCSDYKYISGAEDEYIFVMVPKWNLAVTRLITRKEQKILIYEVYFRNQRVEEAQYTKFGQIVITRRFHTKCARLVTGHARLVTRDLVWNRRGITICSNLVYWASSTRWFRKIAHRVGFLFPTSYKLCNSQVPFRHHYYILKGEIQYDYS